ncbi:MAG TPA: Glu/Leu/Phe/Val dehydrogenase dimerization domain-containing protein [Saprospiraceae bacterium]|nr:Glu/Leu/Phe/Val dehydrogenase dimerization domain-containing protein [Saprospiraceae bacterium]HRK80837.1 Glu/Leu/Phe/Val dehydrogenase dimerization domain-containing protein [Saprospiraceae bacterium]
MKNLLQEYKAQRPEIIFEWADPETGAEGWIVINSLRNGAAGGGTRMRAGLTRDEVVSLAKVMEVKFSVAGPAIGGAKSGINFDPGDPRRDLVLKRWYKAALPILKHYYGTGGDLNVDELKDVVPITEDLGLWHPQEGIVNGHFKTSDGERIRIIGQLRYGCSKIVEDARYVPDSPQKYAVADLITGYGVAESVRHYYSIFKNTDLKNKRAIIQGWGNVASAAACFLANEGVRVVGIIDRDGGILHPEGLTLNEVKHLFDTKKGNKLSSPDLIPFAEVNDRIWDAGAEIFIPGAASKLLSEHQVQRLISGGLEVMACGANVPFTDDDVFFGPTANRTDAQIALIPDFIANCGMARVFAYLMQPEVELTDEAIFQDVSNIIRAALAEVYAHEPSGKYIAGKALELALGKLMNQ